jgi:hypothetical protein
MVVLAQDESPDTRLYDTLSTLTVPMPQEVLKKRTGWRQIPEDTPAHAFMGAAVVLNDRLALVFQKGQPGPRIYSRTTGRLLASAGFVVDTNVAPVLDNFSVVENTAGGVRLKAQYARAGELRFRLTTGEAIVEVQSSSSTGSVAAEINATHVLVPDYFGDDVVYTPPVKEFLPAENFCFNLLAGGDAILMTVWQSNQQDAWILPAANAQAGASVNQVSCMKDKNVWLAFLESPGIWHAEATPSANTWEPPFPAKWRSSFVRGKNEADTWDTEHGPEPGQTSSKHEGPFLTYLIDRTPSTPLTATCPTDVMRNTLGVGPCQYILACEGMGAQGDPTPNSVMGWVEKQFQQKKQRKAADDIKERLGYMTAHVEEARRKIQKYAGLGTSLKKILADRQGSGALPFLANELAQFAAAGLGPDSSPDRARKLAEEVETLLTDPNGLAECEKLGGQLRAIGAIQDRSLARCRMAARRLRQEARTLGAVAGPAPASLREIQLLTEQTLQRP